MNNTYLYLVLFALGVGSDELGSYRESITSRKVVRARIDTKYILNTVDNFKEFKKAYFI